MKPTLAHGPLVVMHHSSTRGLCSDHTWHPLCRYDRIEQQKEQVSQRRAELGLVLESQVRDPNTKAGERRTAAGLLASATSKAWAHQQLLDAHTAELKYQQEVLSRPQNAGETHLQSCVSRACLLATGMAPHCSPSTRQASRHDGTLSVLQLSKPPSVEQGQVDHSA